MHPINQMEPWIGKEEVEALVNYLESGGWLTEFRRTREFEDRIAEYTGSRYVSVVSNGTISLAAAIMALGLSGQDEVIVPDYTMIASANSVVLAGAKPVLADINKSNLCLDIEMVEKAITPQTRAIMLVSINGRSPDMDEFVKFAQENNLYIIEDAAQSLGSFYKGRHLGTYGHIGCFSFSSPKIITTGQGGAVITDDETLHQKVQKIKDFGRVQSGVDAHEIMGYNFKFTDLQAVIGVEQMKKLDWRVQRKKEIYRLYNEFLSEISGISFIETNLDATSPWFIDILVDEGREKRGELIKYLESKQIGSRQFYPAIHTQDPYSNFSGDFADSDFVSERGLWLPSASFLTDEDVQAVCDEIKMFFKK